MVEFDEPLRLHPKGHAPDDATSFIAQTLRTAGIDVPCSLYNEALRLARDGHLGQAHQRLQMLLCLDPDDADALMLTAKVSAAQGRPAEALGKLDAAVAAGMIAPAGFREFLESALRADQARDEDAKAKNATREKNEIGALRNEARHLRSEAVRLEGEAADAHERERLWKIAAITASAIGSVVILVLLLTGSGPGESLSASEAGITIVTPATEAVAATTPAVVEAPVVPTAVVPTAAPLAATTPAPVVAAPVVAAPVIDVDEASVRTHVVGSGDTLYKIAKQYYGDAEQWEKIRDANQKLLKGKIDLKLGTKLKIP